MRQRLPGGSAIAPLDRCVRGSCLQNETDAHSFFHVRASQQICCFIYDQVDAFVLEKLASFGVKVVATRSAGFDHIDVKAAAQLGVVVVRVPKYSPYAVAEHAVGLVLTLNRKLHRAHARVLDDNFSIDGFLGFDLHGKTVGVVGTGNIGEIFARIMKGFGCRVLAYDVVKAPGLESIVEVSCNACNLSFSLSSCICNAVDTTVRHG